jgi:hypothetical protein
VVEQSTHNPVIKGLTPGTGTKRERGRERGIEERDREREREKLTKNDQRNSSF